MSQIPNAQRELKQLRCVRFGAFELLLDTGELRKHGIRVRLQHKPFQILLALIEQPGQIVTREELRARLWQGETFVDFESGLNTAVNRLRNVLGDSAANPTYIETLARQGYRFIASVDLPCPPPSASPQSAPSEAYPVESLPPTPRGLDRPPVNHAILRLTRQWILPVIAVIALAAALVAILPALKQRYPEPAFHQITFRKGHVSAARFTPDGRNIIYSARWNGDSSRLFLTSAAGLETRDIGVGKAWLASVSSNRELALFTQLGDSQRWQLQRKFLNGGGSRTISDAAAAADWSGDGRLCIVTEKDNVYSLEFPAGRKIYSAHGSISDARVSPRGDEVAFLEHPVPDDDAGQVVVVNSSGQAHVLSAGWGSASGLAWHLSTNEIWFTAARSGSNRVLMAVDLRGRVRQIFEAPGGLELEDISTSGKVLIARDADRISMLVGNLRDESERDISWLDRSRPAAIRADGKAVLFDESGEGGGKQYSVYLYQSDTHSSRRLGDGKAMDLSTDGQWALTESVDDSALTLVSVNGAHCSKLPPAGVAYIWAKFFPNGKEILFSGRDSKQTQRIYRQSLPNGHAADDCG